MSNAPQRPVRSHKAKYGHSADPGHIAINNYNDADGTYKVTIVSPSIVKATAANESVGAGRFIKITAAGTYSLTLVGKDYNAAHTYGFGDIVANGVDVYMANEDGITGAFDATKWTRVAAKTIAGIPNAAGEVVSLGRWHNAISAAGFLVDDDSYIPWQRQRR